MTLKSISLPPPWSTRRTDQDHAANHYSLLIALSRTAPGGRVAQLGLSAQVKAILAVRSGCGSAFVQVSARLLLRPPDLLLGGIVVSSPASRCRPGVTRQGVAPRSPRVRGCYPVCCLWCLCCLLPMSRAERPPPFMITVWEPKTPLFEAHRSQTAIMTPHPTPTRLTHPDKAPTPPPNSNKPRSDHQKPQGGHTK
jgi:hypothetical protein